MHNGHVQCVPATRAGFAEAFVQFRRALDGHALGDRPRYLTELVFEEIVTNIIRHGYTDGREHGIRVSFSLDGDSIVLCFEDDGVPFDPRQDPSGEGPAPVSQGELGGRGLLLVRKAASRIEYVRTPDERNRVTVTIAA